MAICARFLVVHPQPSRRVSLIDSALLRILPGTMCILVAVIVPETYGPLLLRRRAQALLKLTGAIYVSKLSKDEPSITLRAKLKTALSRPWLMLFYEPIVLILTIYLSLLYGTVTVTFIRCRCVANEY